MAWTRRRVGIAGAAALFVVLAGAGLGYFLFSRAEPLELRIARPADLYATVPALFDASGSLASLPPDRASSSRVTYRWQFGDGTSAAGARAEHAFPRAGDYAVRLVAEIVSGHRFDAVALDETVTVRPLPAPRVAIAAPSTMQVRAGEAVEFVAAAALPANVAAAGTPEWEYAWYFEDDQSAATGATVTHEFASPGTYGIQVRAAAQTEGDAGEWGATQQRVTVVPAAPVVSPRAEPNAPGERVVAGKPVVFEVSPATAADGSKLRFEWDFDGDGFKDLGPTYETRVRWDEGFAAGGEQHVTVKAFDDFAIEHGRPVTRVLTVHVGGSAIATGGGPGPFVVSGGGFAVGALELVGASAGFRFEALGVSALAGFAASRAPVDIDRTHEFPAVAAAGYRVTTHIASATAYTMTGTYALADPFTVGATIGVLTLEGEHRTSCRCLIGDQTPPIAFREDRLMVGVGFGVRVGFAVLMLQLVAAL